MPVIADILARAKLRKVNIGDLLELWHAASFDYSHPQVHIVDGFSISETSVKEAVKKADMAKSGLSTVSSTALLEAEAAAISRRTAWNPDTHINPKFHATAAKTDKTDVNAGKKTFTFDAERLPDATDMTYVARENHSMWQDSESALMALYAVLNSPAGEAALSWLSASANSRASIYSITGVAAMVPVALKPTDSKKGASTAPLSSHPLRAKPIQMVKRDGQTRAEVFAKPSMPPTPMVKYQKATDKTPEVKFQPLFKGSAEVFASPANSPDEPTRTSIPFDHIVTVLDRSGTNLILVTHFPNAGPREKGPIGGTATNDFYELSVKTPPPVLGAVVVPGPAPTKHECAPQSPPCIIDWNQC